MKRSPINGKPPTYNSPPTYTHNPPENTPFDEQFRPPNHPNVSSSATSSSAIALSLKTTTDANLSLATAINASATNSVGDEAARFSTLQLVLIVVLSVVIVGTVVGNILVGVVVCLVRKLRQPCNYQLVSLAVSDLCVAVLVMPTALLYEVLGDWRFGPIFCNIWVSFDVLSCTASILNLCAISVDRYWAITKPLEYGVKRTPRRMMVCVMLVWLGAACISLPPLLIIGNEHRTVDGRPACMVSQNFGYQIYATLGSFYIPLSVMLFVYYQIFRAARRIVGEENRAQHPVFGLTQQQQHKKLRFQLAKERKAVTTLGIIMSAFTICWLPFFILAVVRPFLGSSYPMLESLFLWAGYTNSLFNPIIYATFNRDFRKPFKEILCFRCMSLNMMMREDFYQSQYGDPASERVELQGELAAKIPRSRESFF